MLPGSLRALLQTLKDQLWLFLQVSGEFLRIRKGARWLTLRLPSGLFQDFQSEGLIAFGIRAVHPACQAQRVVS